MAGILDEVMEGIGAKEKGGTPPPSGTPPAQPPATPPQNAPPATPPATAPEGEKKGAFEYGSRFKEMYGERKAQDKGA
ncbi:MAG: hypothetical protein LBG27_00425 [Spirochaetaceae bacterium]|jgi:hypothetical protein|nr:hypothetical protein [Spirochaetaceae bacterium]